jgi:hypothetical protein
LGQGQGLVNGDEGGVLGEEVIGQAEEGGVLGEEVIGQAELGYFLDPAGILAQKVVV